MQTTKKQNNVAFIINYKAQLSMAVFLFHPLNNCYIHHFSYFLVSFHFHYNKSENTKYISFIYAFILYMFISLVYGIQKALIT